MLDYLSFAKRFIAAAGLAAAVAGAAALGGPAAGAQPTPPSVVRTTQVVLPIISPLQVQAGGTQATVSFTTSVPAAVTYENKPSSAAAARPLASAIAASDRPTLTIASADTPATASGARPGILQQIDNGQPLQVLRQYTTTHQLKLTGLKSNTKYDLSVVAETQGGERLTAQTSYTTAKKRVRFTLESIDIKDDGDGFLSGDGEPVWFVKPIWDGDFYQPAANGGALCYPNTRGRCDFGSYGSGRFTPRNDREQAMVIVYAEENFDGFPSTLSLRAWAKEDDAVGGAWLVECVTGGCPVGDDAVQHDFRVPQGVESTVQRITLRGDDASTGFESVLTFRVELFHDNMSYPWHSRNMPSHTWYDG